MNKTIIWQANTDIDWISKKRSIPYNVHFVRWLPMKRVLAHKNLQYVISLAGSNTVNEIMSYGVPILGIPLHSDQPSNMRRLIELGVGEIITLYDLWNYL
uniref:glucuronosyltransferase n=1 Tax=Acrobeloides nanus TaxID=290746 RepID=A0A914CW59_9BILA